MKYYIKPEFHDIDDMHIKYVLDYIIEHLSWVIIGLSFVLFIIIDDTCKVLWFRIFPIRVRVKGQSSGRWFLKSTCIIQRRTMEEV